MPGQALVTINDNQWSVEVATTASELITGLSGRASIPAGTGMLFVLPARQLVTVDTTNMLFPMDIIFIKDDAILSIAPNIQPGYLVEEATPCDGFLEVNANEAELVEVGDVVNVEMVPTTGFDIGSVMSFVIPLAVLGFTFGLLSSMMKGSSGSSSSSSVRRLGEPRSEEERARVHKEFYGTEKLPTRGKGLEERGEIAEGRGLGEPKTEAERKETHYGKYGTKELPVRGKGQEEYYWEITDIDTGEIIQKGKPYTSVSKVYRGARDYQRRRPGKDKENLVVIRIYDTLNIEEWGKTIKPVMESGMHRGIPILIGKTPLQEEALDRLWPYRILEIHDDGDLTIGSADKKYVVTTDGGVFVHYTTEEALEKIVGKPFRQSALEQFIQEYNLSGLYLPFRSRREEMFPKETESQSMEEFIREQKLWGEFSVWYPKWEEIHPERRSIHGEPRRRLVEEHGSWAVGRAEAICPEDDVACVERESKRLIETIRSRHGEGKMEYVTITDAGKTVFHVGDVVSIIALERENKRVVALGEREATWRA